MNCPANWVFALVYYNTQHIYKRRNYFQKMETFLTHAQYLAINHWNITFSELFQLLLQHCSGKFSRAAERVERARSAEEVYVGSNTSLALLPSHINSLSGLCRTINRAFGALQPLQANCGGSPSARAARLDLSGQWAFVGRQTLWNYGIAWKSVVPALPCHIIPLIRV